MHRAVAIAISVLSMTLPIGACGIFSFDAVPPRPPDQAAFVAVNAAFVSAFEDTDDDFVRAKLEQEWRNKDSCGLIDSPAIRNWTGTVVSAGAPLIVDVGNGVTLKEEGERSASLSTATSGLQEGDAVRITGSFVSDDPACPAEYVGSPWNEKAIKKPDYRVRLTTVERFE